MLINVCNTYKQDTSKHVAKEISQFVYICYLIVI